MVFPVHQTSLRMCIEYVRRTEMISFSIRLENIPREPVHGESYRLPDDFSFLSWYRFKRKILTVIPNAANDWAQLQWDFYFFQCGVTSTCFRLRGTGVSKFGKRRVVSNP